MRLLLALAIALAIGLALTFKGSAVVGRIYMKEATTQAATTLRLAVAALDGHLKRYEALPALIASQNNIEALVFDPKNEGLRARTNAYLKEINALLTSSDIYVMTMDGQTIAASNYDSPVSFIGENFIYRPYFQDAAQGRQSRFYALGTTSSKRGYYFGSPILVDGVIRGVIVFKVDIDLIEDSWKGTDDRIFVSDPEGIIFMTGSPEWLYSSINPLTPERIARTEASRRYADAKLRELPFQPGTYAGHDVVKIRDEGKEQEYLILSQPMPEAGWTVNVLMNTAPVRIQANTTVIAVILTLCLAGLAIAIVLQRRMRLAERMQLQAEARNELERRVVERTADLARVNSRIKEEIAERRLTEQRLRQTQADLIQAGKLAGLGQMSAALSHELNQPLAAVKTYAETTSVLIDRGRIEEASDNLRRISALIDRMASISKHLRNFARKPNEKLGPVSVADVLRDTLEIVDARLKAADAKLETEIARGVPAVKAGAVRLQQVLVNIITNAADAVEGLEDRRITFTASANGNKVVLSVRDRGPGVPSAIHERIFDPFFTTKGVGKGLGLGLSISYNIVKDFGGSLSVADHPEGGAVFLIELDVADDNLLEAAE
ncbi:sensor histidine kinase [Rhizobium sp. NTR19]|uniref:C4-dicarboxylate transport sensor protein n=1 Tax=Neorhizobium turbinariae TaxID=2937795 RepID=A0ABT0ILU4_9HYPH|nr:sensor histidine kinase [Neorhizobium turbinariae]MCK8778859.1 sensor histidine kinase [Neorhizobium turbinariae]